MLAQSDEQLTKTTKKQLEQLRQSKHKEYKKTESEDFKATVIKLFKTLVSLFQTDSSDGD